MTKDTERAAFEAAMQRMEGYPFAAQFANLMWTAWQARAALAQEAQAVPLPAHPVAERCARFAELYRDEHAIGKSAEETCNEIAEACRSYAAPPAAEQDAEKDAALVDAYQKVLSAVSTSRTIYEAEAYLQNLLDAAILAAKEKKS